MQPCLFEDGEKLPTHDNEQIQTQQSSSNFTCFSELADSSGQLRDEIKSFSGEITNFQTETKEIIEALANVSSSRLVKQHQMKKGLITTSLH